MNANPEFVAAEFTDVLLNLMRAIAADSDPAVALGKASDKMHYLIAFMAKMEDGVDFHRIFTGSVDLMRARAEECGQDEHLAAARAGLRYLSELSCFDNAARGRASSRLGTFVQRAADLHVVRSTIENRRR